MLASRALLFIAVAALAAEADKPRCTGGRIGQFWPLEANFQSAVRWQSARQGTLEICAQSGFRKFWKPVALNRPVMLTESERPRCDASLVGQFWPESANESAVLRRKAAQDGTLEICTKARWRYGWKQLSVRYRPPDAKAD